MTGHLAWRILAGAYRDSVVLMQLQRALAALPGVEEAAAVMATPANRELLADQGMLPADATAARPDDLLVAIRGANAAAAAAALARLEELLARRPSSRAGLGPPGGGVARLQSAASAPGQSAAAGYRARSLAAALKLLPAARWVLVSVPGRWAAGVARDALAAGRHVFLYSDNVSVAEEVALKEEASRRGLLVLGPDCGSALVAGTGLGFANRVRRGGVGLVAASGTGLQAIACGVHERGEGISHALGTGGRDLGAEVGGRTALQALDLLARDPGTQVIVLASKPPAPAVAARLLAAARAAGKPVVVWFLGSAPPAREPGGLAFATSSEAAAELAVRLARDAGKAGAGAALDREQDSRTPRGAVATAGIESLAADAGAAGRAVGGEGGEASLLRGLFSGGTLAAEAALALAPFLAPLASNLHLAGIIRVRSPDEVPPDAHLILDLGADELTVGRPHPMLDPALVAARLGPVASDPATRLLLIDVVLGDGAHPDPAGELAPALAAALGSARREGRRLDAVVVLLGTDEDPQDRRRQAERLAAAGANVVPSVAAAVRLAVPLLAGSRGMAAPPEPVASPAPGPEEGMPPTGPAAPIGLEALAPVAAVNVGLEIFYESLLAQGAPAIQVDWRPPAGGDERLARILERGGGDR
jgi:FdrA protein